MYTLEGNSPCVFSLHVSAGLAAAPQLLLVHCSVTCSQQQLQFLYLVCAVISCLCHWFKWVAVMSEQTWKQILMLEDDVFLACDTPTHSLHIEILTGTCPAARPVWPVTIRVCLLRHHSQLLHDESNSHQCRFSFIGQEHGPPQACKCTSTRPRNQKPNSL